MISTMSHSETKSWFIFGRVLFGLLWLYEVLWGHNWKWGNPKWVGDGAGGWLRDDALNALAIIPWRAGGWFLETVLVPYSEYWSYVILSLQLVVAVSLIFGVLVKPIALLALLHMLPMFLQGHWRIPPFYTAGFLVVLAAPVEWRSGIDSWLVERLNRIKCSLSYVLTWLMAPSLPRDLGIAFGTFGAIFFLLQLSLIDHAGFRRVSLELTVLFVLTTMGLVSAITTERGALVGRIVGMFVGYRFLHEIWVVFPVALNGLPGWSTGDQLGTVFSAIATNHYAFMGWIVNAVFIPFAGSWALLFATLQTLIGILLILNMKSRLAAKLGMSYLALLLLLGFSRYVPFMLGLLVWSFMLQSPLRLPRYAGHIAFAACVLLFLATAMGGITPGDYRQQMGPVVAAMIGIFSTTICITAVTQTRNEKRLS